MRTKALAPLLFCVIALIACGEPVTDAKTTASQPQDGGTVVRRLETEVYTLNPICAQQLSERYIAQYLFTPLVYLDAHMRPVPGLAQSWSVSPDARLYRFVLNNKATFSDGSPVRARDVVFTLEKIHDPASRPHNASEFQYLDLAHTRVVNDATVEIAFERVAAAQMAFFADLFILPEHVYGRGNFRDDFNDRAVGSGPYVFVRRDPERIYLQRREVYWRDKPPIRQVIFRILEDANTAWQALKRGDVDESSVPSEAWRNEQTDAALQRRLAFRVTYLPTYICIAWNLRHPFLRDKRVRRALAMSVPIEQITQTLYRGTARSVTGPLAPDQAGYNHDVRPIPYDPVAARKLLEDAGWRVGGDGLLAKDGQRFRLDLLLLGIDSRPLAEMVQDSLKKIGIHLDISIMDGAAGIEYILAGNFEAACLQWNLDANQDLYPLFHSSRIPPHGQNVGFYANPEVDQLLEQAHVESDPARLRALRMRIHALVAEDQPSSFFIQKASTWATSTRLRGVEAAPLRGFFLWYPGEFAWWIPKERQASRAMPSSQ